MKYLPALLLAVLLFPFFIPQAFSVDAPSTVPYEPDHCIGVIWEQGGGLDLAGMLDDSCKPFLSEFRITANGKECQDGVLAFDDFCPGSLKPDIYYVVLWLRNAARPLDVMWVVVNSPSSQAEFDAWVAANTNAAWTAALPKPFASIAITNGIASDPEPPGPDGSPGLWDAPHKLDQTSYLHHNAVWEMRTTIDGDHGNQATYDANGNLICTTIAAGTADHFGPYGPDGKLKWSTRHRNEDVWPYVRALQLDGNPVRIPGLVGFPTRISRPCLYQGTHTETYLNLRPTILP